MRLIQLAEQYPRFTILLLTSFPWVLPIYHSSPPIGYLDPFIYTGYFLDKDLQLLADASAYYYSRLSWLVIGVVFYQIFTPTVAMVGLRILLSFSLSLAFFKILILATNNRIRIWPLLVLACLPVWHPDLAMALFWDYPDGAAITYAAWGIFFLVNNRMPVSFRMILAGFLFTLAAAANMIVVFVIFAITIGYFYSFKVNLKASSALMATGFLLGNVCLMLLGKWLNGDALSYLNHFKQVSVAINVPNYLADMWGIGFDFLIANNTYLLFGIVLIVSLLLFKPQKQIETPEKKWIQAFQIGYCLSLFIHAGVDLIFHKAILRVFYHVSYVLLPMHLLLAITAVMLSVPRGSAGKSKRILMWTTALISGVAFLVGHHLLSEERISTTGNWVLVIIASSAAIFLASGKSLKERKLLVLIIVLLPSFFAFTDQLHTRRYAPLQRTNEEAIQTVLQVYQIVSVFPSKEKLTFIFQEEGDTEMLFKSVGITLGHVIGGNHEILKHRKNQQRFLSGKVVHLASNREGIEKAMRMLVEMGYRPLLFGRFELRWRSQKLWMTVVRYRE